MTGKSQVALYGIALPETAGVSLPTFMNVVQRLALSREEVRLFVEMIEVHRVSVPFVRKLLETGVRLPYVHAAYILREKLEPLYDSNSSGSRSSEFELPVEKACALMAALFDSDCTDDDSIEATARLLGEIANRCPEIKTWSTIIDVLVEALDPVKAVMAAQVGNLLDLPPDEMVEIMLDIIDRHRIIVDQRF